MAKARRTTRVIKRVQKTTVPAIMLELGEGEADFLQTVMANISGSETDSPRKYGVAIARALKQATGNDYTDTDAFKLLRNPRTSSLSFKDYPPRKVPVDNGANLAAAVEYLRTNPHKFNPSPYAYAPYRHA